MYYFYKLFLGTVEGQGGTLHKYGTTFRGEGV